MKKEYDFSKAKRVLKWKPAVGFKRLVKIMVESDLENAQKEARRIEYGDC